MIVYTPEKFARYLSRCPPALAAAIRAEAEHSADAVRISAERLQALLAAHLPPRTSPLPAPPPADPTPVDLATHAAFAAWRAASAAARGDSLFVTPETLAARTAACSACDLWDPRARFGLGKCRHAKCGCTKLKRWLTTESCPLTLWPT